MHYIFYIYVCSEAQFNRDVTPPTCFSHRDTSRFTHSTTCIQAESTSHPEMYWECNFVMLKSVSQREATYRGWVHTGTRLTPRRMAQAGLYYTGIRDKVRCPYCKVELESWELHDDPFSEHCRLTLSPCSFVKNRRI